jgi:cytoskeletal protein RodZ
MHKVTQNSDYRQYYAQLGQQLQAARLAQGISLETLHKQTWVSIVLIRILEAGDQERFPEEIYLRRLVERLGGALGFDEQQMALPEPKAQKIMPSWYDPNLQEYGILGVKETPVQVYAGYLLAVSGLFGSLGWIVSNQFYAEAQSDRVSTQQQQNDQRCIPNCNLQENLAQPETNFGIQW